MYNGNFASHRNISITFCSQKKYFIRFSVKNTPKNPFSTSFITKHFWFIPQCTRFMLNGKNLDDCVCARIANHKFRWNMGNILNIPCGCYICERSGKLDCVGSITEKSGNIMVWIQKFYTKFLPNFFERK